MKRISSYLSNYDPPAAGFSEGKLKDNPGDDTGSGITVLTHNDFLYAFYALVKRYKTGGLSDMDESENNSDVVVAIEEMLGLRIDGVSSWSAATEYSVLGVSVMRHGMQFVNINTTGNLNKDPLASPNYWMACPRAAELFDHYSHGRVLRAECSGVHDYNGALYRQYFPLGRHKVGGASGPAFNAWGVHLDGSTVTGGGTLDTILSGYFLQSVFAPGTPKVLKDARETVDRAMGATSGNAATIGERQEDQFQGHVMGLKNPHESGATQYTSGTGVGVASGTSYGLPPGAWTTDRPYADGTNGAPRIGSETRAKSFVTGVPYFVVMVPA